MHLTDKGIDPHGAVHEHFARIYDGNSIPPFPFQAGTSVRSDDFTIAELRMAISKGKKGKANGADGISFELIAAMNATPEGEGKFLAWFNRLLHGEEDLPRDWNKAVMVVLPKCLQPQHPRQLRPICLGSSANKIYARMLLERSKPAFVHHGPFQTMGAGRQTIDYVWVVNRLMSLEQEWKKGLLFLKLDIEKAFDNLDRGRFLEHLATKLGNCEELRSWWALFDNTEASLATAWGSSTVPMRSGIRQGSVESPQVFASVMDWVLQDVAEKYGWDSTTDAYEGLEFAEMAFVDDCILWSGDKTRLEQKTTQLIQELVLWGLRVNAEKSQAYISPFSRDGGELRVGEVMVRPSDTLDVMGIAFKVGISPKDAMQGIFTKTKNKFWALKHLFKAKTPLGGRLKLLQKVLGGTALWAVGAFVPDKLAMQAINVLQAQLTIWSMNLHKGSGETWVEFRIRCFRAARSNIHLHMKDRWSTLWLTRCWTYSGHRARCAGWVPQPGCAILDNYRTLQWWERECGLSQGVRHPTRFFPRLMGEERALNRAAEGAWREVAQNRHEWTSRLTVWISQQDLAWSSLDQLAIDV